MVSATAMSIMQISQRHLSPAIRTGSINPTGANTPLLLLKSGAGGPAGAMSTYAKIVAPGLLTATIWTQVWLGLTTSLLLAILLFLFLFRAPKVISGSSLSASWAKQASYGERIWLNRLFIPIPSETNRRLTTLYLVFWAGALIALLGAINTSLLLSGTGLIVAYAAQTVCIGKLIELYCDMKDKAPLYRFWTSTPGNDNKSVKKRKV